MAHALGLAVSANLTTNVASYATSSYTPSGGCLLLASVHNTKATLPDIPSLTGNGLTWTMIGNLTFNTTATPLSRLTLFRTYVTGTPVAGTLTAGFGSASQTSCNISVLSISDTVSGANGASGIAAIFSGVGNAGGNPSITGAAITGGENFVIGFFANDTNPFGGSAEAGGWNELVDVGTANPTNGTYIVYRQDTTDNTITVTRAASDYAAFGVVTRHNAEPSLSIEPVRRRLFLVV